jgi:hypothetical protein
MPLQVRRKDCTDVEFEFDAMLNGNFNVERLFDVNQQAFDSGVQRNFEGISQRDLDDYPADFFVHLAVGKSEAAGYLADCFGREIGVMINEHKDFLATLACFLGRKLGDPKSILTLKDTEDDELDDNVLKCAPCVELINHNREELHGATPSLKQALGYALQLDDFVKKLSGVSYLDNMKTSTYGSLIHCIEITGGNEYYIGMLDHYVYGCDEATPVVGDAPEGCCVIM